MNQQYKNLDRVISINVPQRQKNDLKSFTNMSSKRYGNHTLHHCNFVKHTNDITFSESQY